MVDNLALDAVWCRVLIRCLNCENMGCKSECMVLGPWLNLRGWRGGLASALSIFVLNFCRISDSIGMDWCILLFLCVGEFSGMVNFLGSVLGGFVGDVVRGCDL